MNYVKWTLVGSGWVLLMGLSTRIPVTIPGILAIAQPTSAARFLPTSISGTPTVSSAPLQRESPSFTPLTDAELVQHFERVTTKVLDITNLAIGAITVVVTLVGSIVGLFGYRTLREVRHLAEELSSMRDVQTRLKQELERAEQISIALQNRYRYLVECRDSSPEIRKRAIQQLAYSNDIAVISLVIEILRNDRDGDVRAEAVFALGRLIVQARVTNPEASEALVNATTDSSIQVRLQAVESLDSAICNYVALPREAYRRLGEIAENKKEDRSVIEAANRATSHHHERLEAKANS